MRRTIVLTAVLFVIYWFVAARGPRAVGLWQDDAIYVCTAKALATGQGYRHIEIPGQPLQTKYPILYPALLAVGFLIDAEYPHNLVWLLAPTALAAAGLVTLSVRYWRDVLAADRWLLVLAATLAGLSPVLFSFVRFPMSDLLYGLLAVAALYVVDHKHANAKTVSQQRWWLLIAALLVALDVLTRSVGVTLAAALLAVLLWRRQWRHAGLAVLVLALCLAPWYVRQGLATRANGSLQSVFLVGPDLGYTLWLPGSPGDTARVIVQNSFRTAFGLTYFQLALPQQWIQQALAAPSWRTALLHVLSYLAVLLIGLGFVSSLRPRVRLLHVYAVLYFATMLAWPFEPYRLLIPWTPFVLYFLLSGLRNAARLTFRPLRRTGPIALIPVGLIALLLGVCFIVDDARIVTSTGQEYFLREFPIDWTEVRTIEQWVAQNTRANDVLAAADAAGLYLATGRQGYYFWPDTDPYRLFYGPDRAWTTFCLLGSPSEGRHLFDELHRRAKEAYQAAGIRYYIEHRQIDIGEGAMAEYVRAQPELFTPVFATRGRNFTVFRVPPP